MSAAATLEALLAAGAAERPAIGAPGRAPLSYGALRARIAAARGELRAMGIGRDDAVAMVLDNGPEMACAFVAIAASAVTAPLNPAYRAEEFGFFLEDLGARLLLVSRGSASPAIDVARALGMGIAELAAPPGAPAGAFELAAAAPPPPGEPRAGCATGADTALILHTSGTTSRPKMVPLTQANLCASARHIGTSLALAPDDLCLNVMPLFHIHGLVGAVLSSLAAGAGVWCAPGFDALRFFAWLDEAEPSWYTAVPTMHQAILARAGRRKAALGRRPLRFVRSSSAALPPRVMAALESHFGCPVIESYGMTEAAHQVSSNPLPPAARHAGSVGRAAGPELAVTAPDGRLLPAGESGEVVIRGPNVTAGYRGRSDAEAFRGGWFRTGDQGVLDEDGYLRLTGRLKEIINRGGEKISPREIDEVLLDHPAVAQAVTFALPHAGLGEDVAAAVVLEDGRVTDGKRLRDFAARRLAAFKVPRTILVVDSIPLGATGKLQRIGLAEKLGLA